MLDGNSLQGARQLFGTILRLFGSMAYHGVADARDGENVGRLTGIQLHLLAYVADIRFDQSSISIVGEPPYLRHNMACSKYIILIERQQMQGFTFFIC